MDTELLKYIVPILSGIATAIPLVIKLIEYVQKAIKEKNWNQVLTLVINLMKVAEDKFETGAERKAWVIGMVQASADTINYDINLEEISKLIDDLCSMTKVVNPPSSTNNEDENIVVE